MPTDILDEPTISTNAVHTLGTQTMDLCAQHARLEATLSRVEMDIRLTLRDLVNNHPEPDTVRAWLTTQPFAMLGWRIPATCLPADEGTFSTADPVAANTNAPVVARSGNGNKSTPKAAGSATPRKR